MVVAKDKYVSANSFSLIALNLLPDSMFFPFYPALHLPFAYNIALNSHAYRENFHSTFSSTHYNQLIIHDGVLPLAYLSLQLTHLDHLTYNYYDFVTYKHVSNQQDYLNQYLFPIHSKRCHVALY